MALLTRGAVAMTLGLALMLGSWGAGPSASAEGPASVFFGYVFADNGESTPPARVRALSASGAVCGTADVIPSNAGTRSVGFYAIAVASADQKAGCPSRGSVVQFTLVANRVDDGQWADHVALARPGETQQVNLGAAAPSFPGWASGSATLDGVVVLRWIGADGISLAAGLASLGIAPASVARPNSNGVFVDADPAGTLTASDLVLVRLR